LNVEYRDVRHIIPFVTQLWFFITPVVYTSSSIFKNLPSWTDSLLGLNPMSGVVEGFRWALLGAPSPGPMVGVSAAVVLALLISSLVYFRRVEGNFADVV